MNHSFAIAFNGNRIPGVYHHLLKTKEQRFRHHLGSICNQWHLECIQSNISAGFMVEISGGCGTAKGMVTGARAIYMLKMNDYTDLSQHATLFAYICIHERHVYYAHTMHYIIIWNYNLSYY